MIFLFIYLDIAIVPILKKSSGPEILLLKQFRPCIEGISIEIPTGSLGPNETVNQCAERELFKETGYIGKVIHSSPKMALSPGFCDIHLKLVSMSIDMNDHRNQFPQSKPENSEPVELLTGKHKHIFIFFLYFYYYYYLSLIKFLLSSPIKIISRRTSKVCCQRI